MLNRLLYFLNQPEAKSLLFLLSSIVILPLSAFSILFVPHFLWLTIRSSYLCVGFYICGVCFVTRWIARGVQYDDWKIKDLKGKTYLITGSASGIGKQSALQLAKHGAKVILFARPNNLQQTIDDVKKVAEEKELVRGYPLDLSDLLSIEQGIEQYKKGEGENASITALINNAGVMACPYSRTKDDFEMQMGTNHFGHFYLTQLLLPQLLQSKSRVVNVSSSAHAVWQVPCTQEIYLTQLNQQKYVPWNAYSLSKIANIYFTIEFQRRFGCKGLRAYCLHPGAVDTGLQRHIPLSQWFFAPIRFLIFKTQLEGAQTNLFCAISDDAVPGKYHADCHIKKLANPHADNPDRARKWWDYSHNIIAQKIKERHS